VQDIVESLKHAEEIAKLLRLQTEFWMEQVRAIERDHAQGQPAGTTAMPPQWPFPFMAGLGAFSGLTGIPGAGTAVAGVAAATPQDPSSKAAPSAASGAASAESKGTGASSDNETKDLARDQMSELRRIQQEQWERKRSMSSNLGGSNS